MSNKKQKNPKTEKLTIEQFFSIRSIFDFTLSPDNKFIYFISNISGSPQIWRISVNGGYIHQISSWDNAVKNVIHNPKKDELIFMSDSQGDEQIQIYSMPSAGGTVKKLSEGFEGSQTFFISFDKKGEKILFSSNKRLQYNFDTYILNTKTGEKKLVKGFEDHNPAHASDWNSNERYVIFTRFHGNINQDLLLYDMKTGALKNITQHDLDNDVYNAGTAFDKNDKGFYYISDEGSEFKVIRYYSIKKDRSCVFLSEKWDITTFELSKDKKYLLYTYNENGTSVVKLYDIKKKKAKKLKLPKAVFTNFKFTNDDKQVLFICNSPLVPTDIFKYSLKTDKLKRLTNSFVGNINSENFTNPEDIYYKSFDGLKIHALLYTPKGLKKDGTNPAIVWPHGGPEYQTAHDFSKYIQAFTNAGYIVVAPNFRGSTGYGKTFQKKIYKDWGGAEFKDVLASVDVLKNGGYADPSKIAIVGGSFGGFMTLTCITKAPEIWKCAVDIFGPSNLITFLSSVPEHWKSGTVRLVGDIEKDKEMLNERSPINFVDNIKCPLLVVQGKYDPRVVVAESEQIVEKLKSQNKEVDYILLEDEGHGFTKVQNQVMVFNRMIKFLDDHLKPNENKIFLEDPQASVNKKSTKKVKPETESIK
ncbi:S9 family peptidase [soil metagenome]